MSIRKNRVLSAALGAESEISVRKSVSPTVFVESLVVLSFLITFLSSISWHTGGGGTVLRSPVYNLFPVDLRTPPAVSLTPLLSNDDGEPTLSPTLPTLLLFECVLAYMDSAASNALIRWFVDYFSTAPGGLLGGVVYEMFKLNDAFGRVMLNNLKVRLSLSPYISVCVHIGSPFLIVTPKSGMTLT